MSHRLSVNALDKIIFNKAKEDNETAQKNNFGQTNLYLWQNKSNQSRKGNIIWFNSPCNKNVKNC